MAGCAVRMEAMTAEAADGLIGHERIFARCGDRRRQIQAGCRRVAGSDRPPQLLARALSLPASGAVRRPVADRAYLVLADELAGLVGQLAQERDLLLARIQSAPRASAGRGFLSRRRAAIVTGLPLDGAAYARGVVALADCADAAARRPVAVAAVWRHDPAAAATGRATGGHRLAGPRSARSGWCSCVATPCEHLLAVGPGGVTVTRMSPGTRRTGPPRRPRHERFLVDAAERPRLLATAMLGLMSSAGSAAAQSINVDLGQPGGSVSSQIVRLVLLVTVLSLAPSILVMVTSFTRIVIVLSFLRTAIGLQQTPPNSVLVGLALFLTVFVMSPTLGGRPIMTGSSRCWPRRSTRPRR